MYIWIRFKGKQISGNKEFNLNIFLKIVIINNDN